jgi:polyhydroxyalkanoate synthesis regulator phasin
MAPLYKNEVRLNKPQDIRRMLSRVINHLLTTGEMTNEKAKAINALSNTTLKSMEMGDLQEQMEQLREVVQRLEGRGNE